MVRPKSSCAKFPSFSGSIGSCSFHTFRLTFVVVFTLIANVASAAEITVMVDRDPVSIGDSFQLFFESTDSLDGVPDFSPLEQDFEIIGQQQSTNVSMVNGAFSKTARWTVTVIAKSAGDLTIPAISFGVHRSNSVKITVDHPPTFQQGSQSSAPDLILEAVATPENPYVQAQLILTVRVLHRVNISQARLTEPNVANAVIEKLGDDVSYDTQRHGYRYGVLERKYAVFPQQSGILMIEPLELNAQVVSRGQGNSAFNGFFFNRNTQTKRARSKPLALMIKPIPPEFSGKYWLPATQLSITENWPQNPPKPIAGEPITRTLRIQAEGLSAAQLPEVGTLIWDKSATAGGELKQYPDKPAVRDNKTAKGLVGVREEKIALIPSKAGRYNLSAIEIPWWNTETDRMEIDRIPERVITALASDSLDDTQAQRLPLVEDLPETALADRELSPMQDDLWFWKAVSLAMAAGWVGTLIFWRIRQRKHVRADAFESAESLSKRSAVKKLKVACLNDCPEDAKDALLAWGKVVWPDNAPAALGEISIRCGSVLDAAVESLNQRLYGENLGDWSGQPLWKAFSQIQNLGSVSERSDNFDLEPLYKI